MKTKRTKNVLIKSVPAILAMLFFLMCCTETHAYASGNTMELNASENVECEILDETKYSGFFDDDETVVLVFTAECGRAFPQTGYIYLSGVIEDSSEFRVYYQEDDGFTLVGKDCYDENGIKIYAQSDKLIVITANSNMETTASGTITITEETDFEARLMESFVHGIFLILIILLFALFFMEVL